MPIESSSLDESRVDASVSYTHKRSQTECMFNCRLLAAYANPDGRSWQQQHSARSYTAPRLGELLPKPIDNYDGNPLTHSHTHTNTTIINIHIYLEDGVYFFRSVHTCRTLQHHNIQHIYTCISIDKLSPSNVYYMYK